MALEQNGASGRFVATARLHAHVAVFYQVKAADAVLAAQLVELGQYLGWGHLDTIDSHHISADVLQLHILGCIGCSLGRNRPAPHRLLGLGLGILEVSALVADVQQVGVHRVGRTTLLVLHVNGDAMCLCIVKQLLSGEQVPLAPRRNDLDVGLQCVVAKLKPNLVIALASRTMRNSLCADLVGDLDLALGDQRTSDGGAQQVLALVNRVAAKHGKHKIAHELFTQVVNEDVLFFDAKLNRLGTRGLELLALADVGGKRDDLALVDILQPFEDDGGIQAAGVGQHDFFDFAHE